MDDVAFIAALLDDLGRACPVDAGQVNATAMSNGAMMAYRLAAQLSGRIAAVAPVSGTMTAEIGRSDGPVSVLHFHGTRDEFVPFAGGRDGRSRFGTDYRPVVEDVAKLDVPRAAGRRLIQCYDDLRKGCTESPMAFDETLAARVRDALARRRNVEERKMFGCVCFLLNGHALAGVWKDRLIARLGPDQGEAALREPHVRAFDITGKAMRNGVAVGPEGVADDALLIGWIDRANKFVKTLPKKG